MVKEDGERRNFGLGVVRVSQRSCEGKGEEPGLSARLRHPPRPREPEVDLEESKRPERFFQCDRFVGFCGGGEWWRGL